MKYLKTFESLSNVDLDKIEEIDNSKLPISIEDISDLFIEMEDDGYSVLVKKGKCINGTIYTHFYKNGENYLNQYTNSYNVRDVKDGDVFCVVTVVKPATDRSQGTLDPISMRNVKIPKQVSKVFDTIDVDDVNGYFVSILLREKKVNESLLESLSPTIIDITHESGLGGEYYEKFTQSELNEKDINIIENSVRMPDFKRQNVPTYWAPNKFNKDYVEFTYKNDFFSIMVSLFITKDDDSYYYAHVEFNGDNCRRMRFMIDDTDSLISFIKQYNNAFIDLAEKLEKAKHNFDYGDEYEDPIRQKFFRLLKRIK